MRHRPSPARSAVRFSLAALLLVPLLSSCGGGGGGGGGGNDPADAPQLLLADGATLPGGFLVNTIESAALANDRSVAVIASEAGSPPLNGIFLRASSGSVQPILTPSSSLPDGLSLVTMRNLVMDGGGDFSFEIGGQLDDDAVYLWSAGRLSLVARTAPGETPPGFQLLGDRKIANAGKIAFCGGMSPCQVDTSGDRERVTCNLQVFSGRGADVARVELPIDLDDQATSAVTVTMNDPGRLLVGLPSRSRQSVMGEVVDGVYQSLIVRGQQVPGAGVIISAKPRAINAAGQMVIDARMDTDGDGVIDQDRVLRFANGVFESVAQTGEPVGDLVATAVRGNAIDDRGRVLFTITSAEPGLTGGGQSFRLWDAGTTTQVVFEGEPAGKDDQNHDLQVLELDQLRSNPAGEIVYRASVGYFENGTRKTTGTQLDRWVDGARTTVLSTGWKAPDGSKIVEVSIQGLNDVGDLLTICGLDTRNNRGLILLPKV
ncbi:MAG: hypothetical protein ACKPBU_09290 [Alphaproteobacteria bacterium]